MNKRERFMNFVQNKPVDRVPVAFFHHFLDYDGFGRGLVDEAAFERNIEGHRLAREKFDPDVIKIMNDSLMIMEIDTSFVKDASDLCKIQAPALDSPYVQKSLELTKRVLEFYKDSDAPTYATGFSPSMVLRNALAEGNIAVKPDETRLHQFIKDDPEAVACALNNLSYGISKLNELLIKEGGVDGIYFSVNNQAGFFTNDFYKTYVGPAEKRILDNTNKLSNLNLLHICGYHGLSNNLALFLDFDAAAYNIAVHAEGVSLAAGKRLFEGKPVFGGFAQDQTIYTGSKEEVQKATWAILDECGQVGVMIGADCTVPNDIDDSRFNWVREACETYAEEHQ